MENRLAPPDRARGAAGTRSNAAGAAGELCTGLSGAEWVALPGQARCIRRAPDASVSVVVRGNARAAPAAGNHESGIQRCRPFDAGDSANIGCSTTACAEPGRQAPAVEGTAVAAI